MKHLPAHHHRGPGSSLSSVLGSLPPPHPAPRTIACRERDLFRGRDMQGRHGSDLLRWGKQTRENVQRDRSLKGGNWSRAAHFPVPSPPPPPPLPCGGQVRKRSPVQPEQRTQEGKLSSNNMKGWHVSDGSDLIHLDPGNKTRAKKYRFDLI